MDNIPLATLIATVLNLEVNIKILDVNTKRLEQAEKQNAKLGEIIKLLQETQQLKE